MNRYPIGPNLPWHLQARISAMDCYVESGGEISKAIKIFDIKWNTEARIKAAQGRTADPFVRDNVGKFYTHGTVLNLPAPHHAPKMPDDKVRLAADIIAAGYELPCFGVVNQSGFIIWENRFFVSMQQATMLSPQLRALMSEYGVSQRYVLDRIHAVCPEMVHSALPLKIEFTDDQRHARQDYARYMLDQIAADPTFLQHIVWGDESRVYVGKDLNGKIKVWHYRGQTEGASPAECKLMNRGNVIRLDVLLFVNAVWGLCHVEFTTGTTNLLTEGRVTTGMRITNALRTAFGAGAYKVS